MTPAPHPTPLLLVAVVCAAAAGCAWLGAVTGDRRGEAQRLAETARLAEIEGDAAQAESLLAQAAGILPQDAELHRHLARLAWEREDFAAAAASYRRVAALAPDDVEAWRRLGAAHAKLGDSEAAHEAIEQALRHDPHDIEAILLQSRLAEQRGDSAEASQACHRALRNDPENVEARLRLAEIHLRESRADRAAPLLRAICDDGDAEAECKGRAAWALGIAYGRQHRWRDAAAALRQSLDHRPDASADDWYRLAHAHLQAEQMEFADFALDQAIRRDPRQRDPRTMYAAIDAEHSGAAIPIGHTVGPSVSRDQSVSRDAEAWRSGAFPHSASTGFASTPSPSISTSTVSPGLR
ncbi:MAG: tetratricopeptide repeat protein [Planctomycetales bacterium]